MDRLGRMRVRRRLGRYLLHAGREQADTERVVDPSRVSRARAARPRVVGRCVLIVVLGRASD